MYVDNVVISKHNELGITEFKRFLDSTFTIKDLGYARCFLDLEIVRSPEEIFLNQRKYAQDIITYVGLKHAKDVQNLYL